MRMPTVRIAVSLHGLHTFFGGEIRPVVDVAVAADDFGIDYVTLPDHVVMGTELQQYPYGDFPLPEDFAWFEPLTVLAAIAAATQRVRLTTGVLISPLRPAALLAKICATLDQLSAGRFELGVGTGWQREEYDACGVPFDERAARMMDGLRACRALWSGERVSLAAETVTLDRVRSLPPTARAEGIPLWLGMAPTPRVAAWIAELGAGWVAMAVRPESLAGDIDVLRRAYSAAGRDASELRVRAGLPIRVDDRGRPDLGATLDGIEAAAAVGVTDVEIFASAFVVSPDGIRGVLRQIADRAR